jgi:hypothetical protein
MTLFEREFGYAAFYYINDSVLARVWYVVLLDLVTKEAARLLNTKLHHTMSGELG